MHAGYVRKNWVDSFLLSDGSVNKFWLKIYADLFLIISRYASSLAFVILSVLVESNK